MSKPRKRWWGYVRNVIRAYPKLLSQCSGLQRQDRREYEAVNAAKWATERYPNGEARLKVIQLMYWEPNRTYTLIGAGMEAGYQEAQTKEVHREFVWLVAEYLGLN